MPAVAGVPIAGINTNPAMSVPSAAPSAFAPYSRAPFWASPPARAVSIGNQAPNANVTGKVTYETSDEDGLSIWTALSSHGDPHACTGGCARGR